MHILTFFIAWKSKYWYLCFFMVFHGFWSKTMLFSSCFLTQICCFYLCFHVFWFQFTDHPFGKLENVFGVWSLVAENEETHHQSYMYGTFWDKIMPHSCTEWIFYFEAQKAQLAFYNVFRGWQPRMHTYTNKVRIQHKPGSLPVAAHWFFQVYLFWK